MTIELRPMGVACNISCMYCYQHPMRDAGNISKPYDMEAMKEGLLKEGGPFTLFGGEPLLTPIEDLEEIWKWGYETFKDIADKKGLSHVNSIQTNGSLITDEHIKLFKKYDVSVGISIDGPGEMNDIRWAGSLEKTREMTARTEANIKKLCELGMTPGLIITLHKLNAGKDKLPRFKEWLLDLERMGVRNARLHILEIDNESLRDKYALTVEENLEVFLEMLEFEAHTLKTLRFDKFSEMARLLRGEDQRVTCVWNHCDPLTTSAVRGIEGNGERSNCGRTNKEGIDWGKANKQSWERSVALYHTPREYGGCGGCRFFLMCKGQCPGTAIDGDWRNRSEYCDVWYGIFEHLEKKYAELGIETISRSNKREELEKYFIETWISGGRPQMHTKLAEMREQAMSRNKMPNRKPDMVVPVKGQSKSDHGDAHGDHYDFI